MNSSNNKLRICEVESCVRLTLYPAALVDIAPFSIQTIISQDVSLFSGTLRSNLDPFNEHTDQECWDVLERCHLTTILKGSLQRTQESHEITLDMPISQTGSLIAGELQLVAMSRAILRRSNVVILDEATSQIDSDLDDQVSID